MMIHCRSKWTESLIQKSLMECIEGLGLKRMPTRNEIRDYFGDDRLTNKISKTHGYYGWARKLGLEMKNSDTQTGKVGEEIAHNWLLSRGFEAERMSQNYPFDILVDRVVKVDVKFSNLYATNKGFSFYSFRLEKAVPTCDVYLLIAHTPDGFNRFYIVPSKNVMQKQISIGVFNSHYELYRDRVDILSQYVSAFKSIA